MLPQYQIYLMFILPFINEIANALTITQEGPFKRLYKPCNKEITFKLESSIIDLVAFIGIMWNVSYMGSKHGTRTGIIYGIIIVSLSFIIPNTFMEMSVNYIAQKFNGNYIIKSFAAFSFIAILLLIEIIVCNKLKKIKWKYSRYSAWVP